ncbi:hypothetical protein BSK67_24305 [Paenibacillus odorifer]|nr:hypothetical protein BSK67_24305 [Paenibacillus odorifer]
MVSAGQGGRDVSWSAGQDRIDVSWSQQQERIDVSWSQQVAGKHMLCDLQPTLVVRRRRGNNKNLGDDRYAHTS